MPSQPSRPRGRRRSSLIILRRLLARQLGVLLAAVLPVLVKVLGNGLPAQLALAKGLREAGAG